MYARIRQITCIFASRIYWHMCVLRYARPRTPEALPSSAARRPSRRDAAPSRRSATFAVRHPSAEACRPLARPRDTKAAFAAHEIAFAPRRLHEMLGGEQVQIRKFENGNSETGIGSCVFVRREGGVCVQRACRARQGATDAPRRTRRSLKSGRGAYGADRRRRFDMPGRISWSRVSAKYTNTDH